MFTSYDKTEEYIIEVSGKWDYIESLILLNKITKSVIN